jgi:hypothetical protein
MADRVSHRQDRQPESEGDTEQADTNIWKRSGEDGTAAASENQPESADELGACSFSQRHIVPPYVCSDYYELPAFALSAKAARFY